MTTGRNDPCHCGSGKKFKHCHGSAATTPAANQAHVIPLLIQAQQLLVQGNHAGAATILRRVLELDVANVDAQHFLGMAEAFSGNVADGIHMIRSTLTQQPTNPLFHFNLAHWLAETGKVSEAMSHLVRAIEIRSDYHTARYQLLALAVRQGHFLLAQQQAELLLEIEPNNPNLRYQHIQILLQLKENTAMELKFRELIQLVPDNLGIRLTFADTLRMLGRFDDAIDEFDAVLADDPDNIDACTGKAFIEERRHCLDESGRWVRRGLTLAPNHGLLNLIQARLYRRRGQYREALAHLRDLEACNLPVDKRPDLWIETGVVLDKQGCYDEAFDAFQRANYADHALLSDSEIDSPYVIDRERYRFEKLRVFFNKSLIKNYPRVALTPSTQEPIFIAGFPRSGTTLVEQMMGRHPHIHSGGELPGLFMIERQAGTRLVESEQPYPFCLADALKQNEVRALGKLRDYYLHIANECRGVHPDKPRFTDKMPLNENHLGLIWLLFPSSPIIHVVRHPLDTLLSCYSNRLTHGNNCALSLDTLAFHYMETWKLVDHYIAEMDLNYMRVRYEDVVGNPEKEMRRLFEFIGEPWDADCLNFHISDRVTRTASYAQVSRPLYKSSQERWRNYRKHLEPIIPTLAPLIEKLGYSL